MNITNVVRSATFAAIVAALLYPYPASGYYANLSASLIAVNNGI